MVIRNLCKLYKCYEVADGWDDHCQKHKAIVKSLWEVIRILAKNDKEVGDNNG